MHANIPNRIGSYINSSDCIRSAGENVLFVRQKFVDTAKYGDTVMSVRSTEINEKMLVISTNDIFMHG